MTRSAAPLILGLAGIVVCADLFAQPARVPTVTRLVKIFAELEAKVDDAIAASNSSALEALLTDDFELRAGDSPGTPVARAEWLQGVAKQRNAHRRDEQFAVHDEGTFALVSFRQVPQGARAPALFIVDVWQKTGEDWKLAIRYAGSAASVAIPGAGGSKPAIPKKY
ncbi:MAG TPA: nuclear transport factor 2 family protein [Casimicrobiaceae bacterium]|nr:nuclear transport factor 2 family protein [Casimicrobiaceae bacterium]